MYVGFPQRVLTVLCVYFAGERKGMFENNVSDPCDYPHGDLARIKKVGALGKACNPRCYEKCLLCVPQMKDSH